GVEDEQPRGGAGGETVHPRGKEEHQPELHQEEAEEEEAVGDERSDEGGGRSDGVGDEGGDAETHAHPPVDRAEEGGDALVRGCGKTRCPVEWLHDLSSLTRQDTA